MFDAMFTLIGHSGAYVNQRGLHGPPAIHGRGAGAFRQDGKYVQFDTSSARHLVWFAQAAGDRRFGPDLLDVVRLQRREGQPAVARASAELFLTRTAAEWEEVGNARAPPWAGRAHHEWIATDHARNSRAVVQVDDPEFGPIWWPDCPCI